MFINNNTKHLGVFLPTCPHIYTLTPFFFLLLSTILGNTCICWTEIVRWLITSMLWSIRQCHFHFCTGSRHLIGGRGWWWEHKFLILILSLSICCGGRWLLQCSWCLLSCTLLSAFSHSCPLPPYPSYSSPSPAPLPCIPLVTGTSWRCPPCLGAAPPPPTRTPPLTTAGHSHCSLNWPYSLSPCLHIILSDQAHYVLFTLHSQDILSADHYSFLCRSVTWLSSEMIQNGAFNFNLV